MDKGSSKASGDEMDFSSDQPNDEAAVTGRFYECVFCKRGFSTAQALGGHMNIHRKDRAKMRRNQSPTSKPDDIDEHSDRSFNCPPVSESLKNYGMYFPASASDEGDLIWGGKGEEGVDSRRPRELSLFGEELHLGLRVHGKGKEERRVGREEGEVDLELRLGSHEP